MLQLDVPKVCDVLPWPPPLMNLQNDFCATPNLGALEMHHLPWTERMNLETALRTAVEHSFHHSIEVRPVLLGFSYAPHFRSRSSMEEPSDGTGAAPP